MVEDKKKWADKEKSLEQEKEKIKGELTGKLDELVSRLTSVQTRERELAKAKKRLGAELDGAQSRREEEVGR